MLAEHIKPDRDISAPLITAEELFEMGDIGPCELIDGRITAMSPTGFEHSYYEVELGSELRAYVRQQKLGQVAGGEAGILIKRNPDRVRAADVLFISYERLANRPKGYLQVIPELVVEIVSPHDRWYDIQDKIQDYFSIGIERLWIVEPAQKTVRVYRSPTEFALLTAVDILRGEGILDGFALPLAELFRSE